MDISIRKPSPTEVDKVISMFSRIDAESRFMLPEPGERDLNRERQFNFVTSVNKDNSFIMFVLASEDKFHGYVIGEAGKFKRNSKTMSLVIGIEQKRTGKGYGKLLMDKLISKAIEGDIRRIELTVVKENIAAIKLYEKCGFSLEGTKRDRLLIDGKFVDELVMAKIL